MSARVSVMQAWSRVIAVIAFVALSGCHHRDTEAEKATKARRVLAAYFECGECTEDQLRKVSEFGEYVVPSLRLALAQGPSNSRNERMRQFLSLQHRRIVTYRQTHPGPGPAPTADDEPRFVQAFLANYKAQYQIRAATVLAAIGTPDARRSLEQALQQQDLRPDVRAAITRILRGGRGDNRPAAAN